MHTNDYYIIIYFSVQVGFRRTNMDVRVGDILEMKKQHPCKKSNQWKIVRMGADIKVKCLGCNAIVMFSRRDFEKRLKKVVEHAE